MDSSAPKAQHETYVGWVCGIGSQVHVNVLGCELCSSDLAVLSRQVTSLTCLGLGGIACGYLAAVVRVQVGASARAVAIGGDGLGVDVVGEGTLGFRQSVEGNGELDTVAVRHRSALHGDGQVVAGLWCELSPVPGVIRVVGDEGSRSGLGADGCGRGKKSNG